MQFICDQNHKFHYPAKLSQPDSTLKEDIARAFTMTKTDENVPLHNDWEDVHDLLHSIKYRIIEGDIETSVCPFCQSKTFTEYVEAAANVENVYIYELTSGPQTALDGLLAQGYVITNRYAKAYHLEKPKATPQQSEDKFTEDAKIYYSKLHPGETTQ